jgi:hypothetical protein
MKLKAILQCQIESFRLLTIWTRGKSHNQNVCSPIYLSFFPLIVFSVFIFYTCSDTVTTVQNNIVFGAVIVQRSAHIYSCFENNKKIISWHKILVQQKKTTQCSFPLETLSPKPLISGVKTLHLSRKGSHFVQNCISNWKIKQGNCVFSISFPLTSTLISRCQHMSEEEELLYLHLMQTSHLVMSHYRII